MKRYALLFVAAVCWADPNDELKSSVRAREPQVRALVEECKAKEGPDGVLRPLAGASDGERRTIAAENADRDKVWETIAVASNLTKDEVSALFAERAQQRNPAGGCSTATRRFKAPTPENVARLLQFLKQGILYAKGGDFANSLKEFEAVLRIDEHFPGAKKNLGSSLLRLQRGDEAAAAFQGELDNLTALEKLSDGELEPHCYFVESGAVRVPVADCRRRLRAVRAFTHYSRACQHSLAGRGAESITELQLAVASGFDDLAALRKDPDLAAARRQPDFAGLLSKRN